MLNPTSFFSRAVAMILVAAICWTPTWITIEGTEALARVLKLAVVVAHAQDRSGAGYEDQIDSGAESGKTFGRSQAEQFSQPTFDNGHMTFPDADESLNVDELYPDSNVDSPNDSDNLTSLYGSDSDMQTAGQDARKRLNDENSTTGSAYRVLVDQTQLAKPDLTDDPVFDQTDKVNKNIDVIGAGFADCSKKTTYQDDSISAHVPDLRHCTRNSLPTNGDCQAHQVVKMNKTSTRVRIGAYVKDKATFKVDLKNGSWVNTDPEHDSEDTPQYVADIPTFDYDDLCSSDGANSLEIAGKFDWPEAPLPGRYDSSVEYRVLQKPSCGNNLVGIVQIDDAKGSGQFFYKYGADFRLAYRSVDDIYWDDKQCAKSIQTAKDFCGPGVDVITNGGLAADNCADFNGNRICQGSALAKDLSAPAPGYSKWLNEVDVSGMNMDNCDYWKGSMSCWTDTEGVKHCPEVDSLKSNQCQTYENDPNCGFVGTECTEGGKSASGQCVVQTETWDCGYDADVPTVTSDTKYSCAGAIRCMGTECADPNGETSDDFARASAALQAAEAIRQDGSCKQAANNGDENVEDCKIFKGKAYECKKAVGGYVDCCKAPQGVSMGDYLTLMYNTHEALTTSLSTTALGGTSVSGAWETLRAPYQTGWNKVTSAWSSIKGGFANAYDSLTGASQAAGSEVAKKGIIATAKQALMKKTAQWTAQAFGPQAANALFVSVAADGSTTAAVNSATGEVAKDGAVQLGGTIGTALSGVMLAYTAYTVAKLLIQIIWACEQEEFVLGAKRQLKSCHYLGSYCKTKTLGVCIEKRQSYCCFNSPLSRIIQEQARPQLGMSWGDTKNPDCGALTTSQISEIDWDKINLDEWLGILKANDHYPNADNLNAQKLTGLGSPLSLGDREDVTQRTQDRIDGIDVPGRREEAAGDIRKQIDLDPPADIPYTSVKPNP